MLNTSDLQIVITKYERKTKQKTLQRMLTVDSIYVSTATSASTFIKQ